MTSWPEAPASQRPEAAWGKRNPPSWYVPFIQTTKTPDSVPGTQESAGVQPQRWGRGSPRKSEERGRGNHAEAWRRTPGDMQRTSLPGAGEALEPGGLTPNLGLL